MRTVLKHSPDPVVEYVCDRCGYTTTDTKEIAAGAGVLLSPGGHDFFDLCVPKCLEEFRTFLIHRASL